MTSYTDYTIQIGKSLQRLHQHYIQNTKKDIKTLKTRDIVTRSYFDSIVTLKRHNLYEIHTK